MKNTLFALFLVILLISVSSAVFADNEGESKDSVKHGGPFRTVPSDAKQVPSYGIYEAKKTIKLFDVDKRQERKERFKRNVKLVKDIYEGAVLVEYTKDRINDSSLVPRMSETRRDFFKYLIDVNMNSYSKVDNIIIKKSSVCEFRNIKNNDFVKIDDKKVWINGRSYQIRFDDKRSNDDILELKNQSLRWIYFDADLNNFESGNTIQASFLINPKYFSFDVDEDGNLFLSKIPECLSKFFYKEGNDTYIANKNCPDIDSTWIIVGNNDEQIGYVYVKA